MSYNFLITGCKFTEKKAVLYAVDFKTGEKQQLLEYGGIKGINENVAFTHATLLDNALYLCTRTEVLIYSFPELQLRQHFTHRLFNDVHHIEVIDDRIYVVSTGIDAVLSFSNETFVLLEHISLRKENICNDYPKECDFRKINTEPHQIHPNYVFQWQDKIFVSRFNQEDITNIHNHAERYEINSGSRIHDGIVNGQNIYLTTIDGTVKVLKPKENEAALYMDMNQAENSKYPLGWCRGLSIDEDFIYVGFSRFRHIKLVSGPFLGCYSRYGEDLKSFDEKPTRVTQYNRVRKEKCGELVFDKNELSNIYSIIRY